MHLGDTKGDTKLSTVCWCDSTSLARLSALIKQVAALAQPSRPVTLPPALFIRRLRFLFAEFLEARIIPQRIEHRIEPEQRGREHDAHTK